MIKITNSDIFGDFQAITRDFETQKNKKSAAAFWKVKCIHCGLEKTIRADTLRKSPICKCSQTEVGKEFQDWKVLEKTSLKAPDKCIIYKCQCKKCGNIENIASNVLRSNRKKCSFCHIKKSTLIDMTGQTFGYLEVLERDTSKEHLGHENDAYWICLCHNCGAVKSIRGISLRKEKSKSCGCIKSHGEEKITKLLTEHNISFAREFSFSDLFYQNIKNKLRFDFAIFNNKGQLQYLLEYDGQHHFEEGVRNSGWNTYQNFILTKERDELKNQYCNKNKIPLIRIKYNEEITINKLLRIEKTMGGEYGT